MKVEYDPLSTLPGIGEKVRVNLYSAGYGTVEDVRQASADELQEIPYIGEQKAEFLTEYLD